MTPRSVHSAPGLGGCLQGSLGTGGDSEVAVFASVISDAPIGAISPSTWPGSGRGASHARENNRPPPRVIMGIWKFVVNTSELRGGGLDSLRGDGAVSKTKACYVRSIRYSGEVVATRTERARPMSFHMKCTKCGSSNIDLQKDQRAFVSDGRNQVLLHCYTCGHVIYGEAKIQAECNRQYSEWEARTRSAGRAAPANRATRALNSSAAQAAKGAAGNSGEVSSSGSGSATLAEALVDFPFKPGDVDPVTGLTFVFPSDAPPMDNRGRPLKPCVWPPCEKYARPRSKYCSRNCSNKNARARYSKRTV